MRPRKYIPAHPGPVLPHSFPRLVERLFREYLPIHPSEGGLFLGPGDFETRILAAAMTAFRFDEHADRFLPTAGTQTRLPSTLTSRSDRGSNVAIRCYVYGQVDVAQSGQHPDDSFFEVYPLQTDPNSYDPAWAAFQT